MKSSLFDNLVSNMKDESNGNCLILNDMTLDCCDVNKLNCQYNELSR